MDDYHQLIADSVTAHAAKLGRLVDYIETGVLTGNSAEAVLATGKVRYAVLIDIFPEEYCGHKPSVEKVSKRLERYEGLFRIVQGDSKLVLPTIIEKFDVAFVDGDHSEAGCRADMVNILPLLREDGIMFVDDLDDNGCKLEPVARRFAFDERLQFTFHYVHNGLGELRR